MSNWKLCKLLCEKTTLNVRVTRRDVGCPRRRVLLSWLIMKRKTFRIYYMLYTVLHITMNPPPTHTHTKRAVI